LVFHFVAGVLPVFGSVVIAGAGRARGAADAADAAVANCEGLTVFNWS
jgi:hypothetical protein